MDFERNLRRKCFITEENATWLLLILFLFLVEARSAFVPRISRFLEKSKRVLRVLETRTARFAPTSRRMLRRVVLISNGARKSSAYPSTHRSQYLYLLMGGNLLKISLSIIYYLCFLRSWCIVHLYRYLAQIQTSLFGSLYRELTKLTTFSRPPRFPLHRAI